MLYAPGRRETYIPDWKLDARSLPARTLAEETRHGYIRIPYNMAELSELLHHRRMNITQQSASPKKEELRRRHARGDQPWQPSKVDTREGILKPSYSPKKEVGHHIPRIWLMIPIELGLEPKTLSKLIQDRKLTRYHCAIRPCTSLQLIGLMGIRWLCG